MERKVIFLDIDGTLTEPGKNVPPDSALEAVRKAREKGNLVYLCSGRNYAMLQPLLQYGFDGYIASSGGYIVAGDKVIFDSPMSDEDRRRAVEVLQKNGVFCTLESLHGTFSDERFKDFLRSAEDTDGMNSEMLRWRIQFEESLHMVPLTQYRGEPVYKMVLMCSRLSQLDEPQSVLKDRFLFSIPKDRLYGFVNAEVQSSLFDKGRGVRRVCEYLDLPLEQSVGFGDSANDLQMMQTVGFSVCMGNGAGEVKELADAVCGLVSEDGLYRAFEQYQLM